MKYRNRFFGMFAIVTTLIISISNAKGQIVKEEKVWVLQERKLPLSQVASKTLRDHLVKVGQPNLTASLNKIIHSQEEWDKLIVVQRKPIIAAAKALAKRMKTKIKEEKIAGVTVFKVIPKNINPKNKNRLFVHAHGGAYVFNGGKAGLIEAILIANRTEIPVISIDYRMPPKHPFPAALEDVVLVWKGLLKRWDAKSMALGGTSAGGGLVLASIHKFKELELPLPGALFAGTPWSDLTKTGDSYFTNEGIDTVLVSYEGILDGAAKLYAGNYKLTNSLISPVYGDFKGFPPTYLVSGTRDMFLSNTVRVHRKLRTAGVEADLNIYESLSHAEYLSVIDSPESKQVFIELEAFLLKYLK